MLISFTCVPLSDASQVKKSQRISCFYVDCLDVSKTLYSTSQITSSVYIYDIIMRYILIYIYILYIIYVMFRTCSLVFFHYAYYIYNHPLGKVGLAYP